MKSGNSLRRLRARSSTFVAAKNSEGVSLDEAFALFSLELPLCFEYERHGGRVRPRYGFRIIERAE
ncbi:hypothetical protein C3Y89_24270 [Rhizobium sp. UPM1132]|nr:hypothetical protein [Rhizobium ruizarguesonis]